MPPRLAQLDGLRGLAALYVVLHHAWLTIWPLEQGRSPGGVLRANGVLAYGQFAVAVFIVLSGFCLGLPVVRAGWRLPGGAAGFFRRRARRILPPYYAALGLSLVLIATVIGDDTGTHWDLSVPVDATGLAAALLLVENVLGQSQVNHVFWSIAVETQIYLLFPALVLLWARRGARATAGAAAGLFLGVLALVTVVPVAGPVVLSGLTPQMLVLFVLGVLAAAAAGEQWPRRALPWGRVAAAGTVSFVALCAALGQSVVLAYLVPLDLLAGAVTAAGLVALCRSPRARPGRLLSARPLVTLGTFAYSTYLVHAPILQLVWLVWLAPLRLGDGAELTLLLLVGVPAALGLSYGFFLAFERPFLRSRRPEATATGGPGLLGAERRATA